MRNPSFLWSRPCPWFNHWATLSPLLEGASERASRFSGSRGLSPATHLSLYFARLFAQPAGQILHSVGTEAATGLPAVVTAAVAAGSTIALLHRDSPPDSPPRTRRLIGWLERSGRGWGAWPSLLGRESRGEAGRLRFERQRWRLYLGTHQHGNKRAQPHPAVPPLPVLSPLRPEIRLDRRRCCGSEQTYEIAPFLCLLAPRPTDQRG